MYLLSPENAAKIMNDEKFKDWLKARGKHFFRSKSEMRRFYSLYKSKEEKKEK